MGAIRHRPYAHAPDQAPIRPRGIAQSRSLCRQPVSAPEIRAAQFLFSRLTGFISGSNPRHQMDLSTIGTLTINSNLALCNCRRCLRLSFRRTRYRGLWFMAPCHREFFYVQLTDWRGKPLGESNLARDRFFLRASSAHSVRAFLILTPFFDGDHVGGDSRHPLTRCTPGCSNSLRGRATARSDDGHRGDHDYRDRARRRAGAGFF